MRRSTSDEAFQKIISELPARRAEVFEFVWKYGPATAKELEDTMYRRGGPYWRDCNKRLSELERQGVIEVLEERVCEITGNKAMAWKATGRMPKPLQRKARLRKRVFAFKIEECRTCLLAAEDDQGVGCCFLDETLATLEEGRPIECPMDLKYDELVAST